MSRTSLPHMALLGLALGLAAGPALPEPPRRRLAQLAVDRSGGSTATQKKNAAKRKRKAARQGKR